MGNIQAPKSNTLYSQILSSKPAQFTKENPVLAGAGIIGSGVIVHEAAKRSDILATGIKKGLVPAAAAGGAILGASMVKDAFQNDDKFSGKFMAKTLGGTALVLTGTEVAGRTAFGVSPLTKAAELASKLVPGPALAAGAISLIPGSVAAAGLHYMNKNGLSIGNAAAVGAGATGAALYMGLAVNEAFNFGDKAGMITEKAVGVVGGASLGLGAVALGKHALQATKEGKTGQAVLAAIGATTAGAASIHVLGNATGIQALSNLGQKVFLKNPLLAGSITAVAMAGAGYYMYSKSQGAEKAAETPKQ